MRLLPLFAAGSLLLWAARLPSADEPSTWRQGEALPTLSKNGKLVHLAYSPDGRRLVSVQQRNITLWNLASRKPLTAIEDVNVTVWYQFVGFTADNRAWFVTTRREDRAGIAEIALVDLETRKTRTVFKLSRPFGALTRSPDGRYLAHVSEHKSHYNRVLLHAVETGEQIDTLPGRYTGPIRSLNFSADSSSLVAGHGVTYRDNDGRLTVWVMTTRKQRWNLAEPAGAGPVALSADSKRAAWFRQGGVRVADLADGKSLARISNPAGKRGWPESLALSPNGSLLAVCHGGEKPRFAIWRVSEPAAEVITLLADAHGVTELAFAPDGRTLLVGKQNGEVLVFNASK